MHQRRNHLHSPWQFPSSAPSADPANAGARTPARALPGDSRWPEAGQRDVFCVCRAITHLISCSQEAADPAVKANYISCLSHIIFHQKNSFIHLCYSICNVKVPGEGTCQERKLLKASRAWPGVSAGGREKAVPSAVSGCTAWGGGGPRRVQKRVAVSNPSPPLRRRRKKALHPDLHIGLVTERCDLGRIPSPGRVLVSLLWRWR